MTDRHSRPGRRSRRKAYAQCRRERHRYGSPQQIGGGILRRICFACGMVSIDLTGATDHGAPGLFSGRVVFEISNELG